MSTERDPSPEQALTERMLSVLGEHYHNALVVSERERDEYNKSFHGLDEAEIVKKILEKNGIDTTDLEIKAKWETHKEARPDIGPMAGDAFEGINVKISSHGKDLLESFFESPDNKWSY